jgi:glycine cleavage system transcriptional repressor
MKRYFAISAIGNDRPGIVADVAGLIYEAGCNMEDSNMSILGTQFALLTLLSGRGEDLEQKLLEGCKRLEREKNLTLFLTSVEAQDFTQSQRAEETSFTLTAEGLDRTGIVFRVCQTLADFNINITDMKTRSLRSPESGTPIYTMAVQMAVPDGSPMNLLQERLDRVSDELAVDIELHPGVST